MSSYNVSPEILSYREHLHELKINSKIHINNLTLIAQENPALCQDIVKEIEERIRTAPAIEKLPSLYLLDSIVKNVGQDYLNEFSKNLVHTFCQAYEAIPEQETRNSLLRLLKTWPALFPPEKIGLIEQRLALSAPAKAHPSTNRTIHVNPQLFKKQPQQPSPYSMAPNPYGVAAAPPPHHMNPYAANYPPQPPANSNPYATYPAAGAPFPYHSNAPPSYNYNLPPAARGAPYVQQPPQAPAVDTSSLMKTLGLLSSLAADTANAAPTTTTTTTMHANTPQSKARDAAVFQLYQAFAAQCSNCGLRYHNTQELNQHLDKHYETQSRKAKSKALARKWYQPCDEWITKVDEEVIENPGAFFFNQLKQAADTNLANKNANEAAADASRQDVVADEETSSNDTCPMCKEQFERYWNKAREEWVYKNSVRHPTMPNRIAHRSCLPRKRDREDEASNDEPYAKRIKLE